MGARRSSIHGEWSSRLAFVLAATGSAVGLGNIWRFPYVAGESGGGAFVLVYLLCVVAIGMPVMMSEILIGRRGRRNPVRTMELLGKEEGSSARWRWVGGLGVVAGILILSYYSVIAGWTLAYIVKAGSGFGGAVVIETDTLIVGAASDDEAATDAGAAYVYVRDGGVWALQSKLTASDAAAVRTRSLASAATTIGRRDPAMPSSSTEVVGNTILGFGHPMFGEGRVSVPMATAVVHLSYPSLMRSFKLAGSAKPRPVATTFIRTLGSEIRRRAPARRTASRSAARRKRSSTM